MISKRMKRKSQNVPLHEMFVVILSRDQLCLYKGKSNPLTHVCVRKRMSKALAMRSIFGVVDAGCQKEGSETGRRRRRRKRRRGERERWREEKTGSIRMDFIDFALSSLVVVVVPELYRRSDSLGDDTSRITWRTHTHRQLDQKDNADGSLPLSLLTKSSGILDGVGVKLFSKRKWHFHLVPSLNKTLAKELKNGRHS